MPPHSTGDGRRPDSRQVGPDAAATQTLAPLDETERERLLRAIVEADPECVNLLGADGSVRMMNPAGLRMIEADSFEQVRGRSVYPLIADEDRAAFQALTERVFRGESGSLAFRIVGLKGTPRWLETHAVPFRDEHGEVAAALGMTRDITDRVLADEALRESERNFRMLFEQATDGILVCDDELHFLDANAAACQITGYTREELLSLGVADMLPPEERDRLAEKLSRFSAGQIVTLEFIALRRDGSRYTAEVTGRRLPDGRCQSFVRDITERRRVETALRESERNFRMLFEQATDGILVCDDELHFLDANPAACQMTGYTREELLGLSSSALLDPSEASRLPQEVARLDCGQAVSSEWRGRRKDGSVYMAEATAKRLPDGRIQTFARDISERTELQAQFLQAQKMESIGHLAGGIAHDFNNLLTIIKGTADLAIAGLHGDNPLRQDLEQIRHAGERAATMTRQLLAMSRQQLMQLDLVDLNAVVIDMQGMLQRLVGEDIALQLALAEPLGRIKADPSQIEQVILNLAVNARDAMPEGGRLTIETREVMTGPPAHQPMAPGPCVMLAVRDTGIGMDEAARKRVFEPFFTTKEVGKGTGLGLSTVYGIVKQSGGSVWLESRPGAGTTFTLYFPRVQEAAVVRRPPVSAAIDPEGSETILVVEDEPGVRSLTTRVLESAGYRVVAAANGAEALQVLERFTEPIHMLLTDVVMPGMNGRELATRVVQLRPDIKVLYTTGYTADGLLRRGVLDATSRVVTKPFTARELRRKVREELDSPC